jgi:hypothetical protein
MTDEAQQRAMATTASAGNIVAARLGPVGRIEVMNAIERDGITGAELAQMATLLSPDQMAEALVQRAFRSGMHSDGEACLSDNLFYHLRQKRRRR